MRALLLKDLVAIRRWLWLIVPSWILTALTLSRSSTTFFWSGVALAGVLAWLVPGLEWRSDASRFVCSLPVARATVVRARLTAALVAAVVSLGCWLALGRALEALVHRPASFASTWAGLEGVCAYVATCIVLTALVLPCYFRFGFGKGSAVSALLVMGACAATGALGSSVMPAGIAAGQSGFPAISDVPATLLGLFGSARQHAGGAVTGLGAVMAGVAVLWSSARLSMVWYERQEF
jgi:hypothetical protein